MQFKKIETAPSHLKYHQILCRFFNSDPTVNNWIYFTTQASGIYTSEDGYALPEEWCELPGYENE